MSQEPNTIETAGRAHQWINKKVAEGATWDERDCPLCGLHDQRKRSDMKQIKGKTVFVPTPEAPWGVTTPCIEPVPESITYEAFMADLKEHDCLPGPRSFMGTPHAMGHPGKWRVGLRTTSIRGGAELKPAIEVEDLERGWTLLLRWIRARQYLLTMHRYESTGVHGMTIAHDTCGCCDDD